MNKQNAVAIDSKGYAKSFDLLINIRTEKDKQNALRLLNAMPLSEWSFVDFQASSRVTRWGLCAHINIMIREAAMRQGYATEEIKPYIKAMYCCDAVRAVDEPYNAFCETLEERYGISLKGTDEESDGFKIKMTETTNHARISFSPYQKATQRSLKVCREGVEKYFNIIMAHVI